MKKLTLSVAALSIAMMSYGQTQCKSLTKDSVQCKNTTKYALNSGKTKVQLCYLHNPNYVKPSESATVVCGGTTKSGKNCKNKTKNTKGLCHNHKED
tara:strand:+ start:81 stop:371 length:291 start_codon:yes stop_codon:yes gene_type:complete